LEQRLDTLSQQVNDIRQELNQLRGTPPVPPPAATEDLTKVETVPSAPQPAAPAAAPSLTDVQTVNNVVNPGAAKVFNPDTSVIGNFLGRAGQTNPYEFPGSERPAMKLDEAEVGFQAFVDPYAKANFFISITPEGAEVEEGYAQFIALPADLTAKAGKFKALFGKANTWHTHVRPWVDQPLVIHNLFGDEQFHGDGISVSKLFPNAFAVTEGTVEVFQGDTPDVFEHQAPNDLTYNGHLKLFKDISENSNIEVGGSYARGTIPAGHSSFGGVDVTYRWKPLEQGLYRGVIARFEGIVNRRDDADSRLRGFYTSLDYQLGQRWFTGVRLDSSDEAPQLAAIEPGARDRGLSATLTFWPSEFSQLRGQLRRTRYGDVKAVNELLLQLQFSIGAHGAHSF